MYQDQLTNDMSDDDNFDAAKLLRRLLRALGVEVGAPTDGELVGMTARTISELRNGVRRAVQRDNRRQAKDRNPLIPDGAGGEIEPVAMSLTPEQERAADALVQGFGTGVVGNRVDDDMSDFERQVARHGR